MNDVSVAINTCDRTKRLRKCIKSVIDYDFSEIIVTDDGKIGKEKRKIYRNFEDDIELVNLDYDTGIARCRNVAVDKCDTEYLMILDDDMELTNFNPLLDIIESDKSLGGISAFLLDINRGWIANAYNLYRKGNKVYRDIREDLENCTVDGCVYFKLDMIPNSTLFRMDCLEELKWDDYYKIGYEHLDFYLRHKEMTDWDFAITPHALIKHNPEKGTKREKRFDNPEIKKSKKHFEDKHGVKEAVWISSLVEFKEDDIIKKFKRLVF